MTPLTRRYFLKSAGLSLFGAGFVPSFMRRTAFALEQPGRSTRKKILVAVFQRGAADGLNIVVPFGERDYYSLRPSISIPEPGRISSGGGGGETAIDLDGFFGFHPSLTSLKPLFDARHLAVIHAAGSPDSTRSHFDAQDYMESATPGLKSTQDGWLNRYLQLAPETDARPFRAVAFSARTPRSLLGSAPALAVDDLRSLRLGPKSRAGKGGGGQMQSTLEAMYASASDPLLNGTARETFEAVSTLQQIGVENYQPANGAEYPRGPLGHSLQQVAQLIKADVGLEVAFAEVGGWDHHVNEGGVQGQLANSLKQFGDALAAFHQDMGDRMADVVVLTMTEFGRAARENGSRGTDHGHANAMFALGGSVRGGKVYGKWPGLKSGQLFEGRDLALTTDFRDVFAEVLVRHLGARQTASVFPGFAASSNRFRGFLG
jgi:uncharacterized protein (DUF1501 family)